MPDTYRAQRLLALFTSAESAEGIAGDLAESHDGRSSFAFWRRVLTMMVALSGHTIASAPLTSLGLLAAGCWLAGLTALDAFGSSAFVSVHFGLMRTWTMVSLIYSLMYWSGAFFTGAALAGLGQARGMAASVGVAILNEALLMAFGPMLRPSTNTIVWGTATASIFVYSVAALAPFFLILGAAIVRVRPIARDHAIESQE